MQDRKRTRDEHDGRLPDTGVYFLPVHHVCVEPANPEAVDCRKRALMPDVETVVQGTCRRRKSRKEYSATRNWAAERLGIGVITPSNEALAAW